MRERGYLAGVVEKWVQVPDRGTGGPPGRRIDLFGFIDIVAVRGGEILGVQTTSGSGLAARITKAQELDTFRRFLAEGGVVEFHGWRQLADGKWYPLRRRFIAKRPAAG